MYDVQISVQSLEERVSRSGFEGTPCLLWLIPCQNTREEILLIGGKKGMVVVCVFECKIEDGLLCIVKVEGIQKKNAGSEGSCDQVSLHRGCPSSFHSPSFFSFSLSALYY